ncbi:hypothetical protein LTR08_004968 [Meristemomyces frigidus]|nr:hypothetical protein LTR08_004968 [Meristemomyces frigidus]
MLALAVRAGEPACTMETRTSPARAQVYTRAYNETFPVTARPANVTSTPTQASEILVPRFEAIQDICYDETYQFGSNTTVGCFLATSFEQCIIEDTKIEDCTFINMQFINCTFEDVVWADLYLCDVVYIGCTFKHNLWRLDKCIDKTMENQSFVKLTQLGEESPSEIKEMRDQQLALFAPGKGSQENADHEFAKMLQEQEDENSSMWPEAITEDLAVAAASACTSQGKVNRELARKVQPITSSEANTNPSPAGSKGDLENMRESNTQHAKPVPAIFTDPAVKPEAEGGLITYAEDPAVSRNGKAVVGSSTEQAGPVINQNGNTGKAVARSLSGQAGKPIEQSLKVDPLGYLAVKLSHSGVREPEQGLQKWDDGHMPPAVAKN